jgi:hypothetical protein
MPLGTTHGPRQTRGHFATPAWRVSAPQRQRLTTPGTRSALLLEDVHPASEHALTEAGISVRSVSGALDEHDLIQAVRTVDILGIRSKTQVSARVLEKAPTYRRSAPSA